MQANTAQVRAILKQLGISAHYTEKGVRTSPSKDRIVMANIWAINANAFYAKVNAVEQKFAQLGYTNKVYSTQGQYLRIKTFLA